MRAKRMSVEDTQAQLGHMTSLDQLGCQMRYGTQWLSIGGRVSAWLGLALQIKRNIKTN